MIVHIESVDQFNEEIKTGKVIVDFYATWCGPCSMLAPILEKIANEHPEVKVLKVDTDQNQKLAANFDVYSIPTLLYYQDGVLKDKKIGYIPEVAVKKFAQID